MLQPARKELLDTLTPMEIDDVLELEWLIAEKEHELQELYRRRKRILVRARVRRLRAAAAIPA